MIVTTEYVYFGGYAFVIVFSLATVIYARRAARMDEFEEERERIAEAARRRAEDPANDAEGAPSEAAKAEAAKGDDTHE